MFTCNTVIAQTWLDKLQEGFSQVDKVLHQTNKTKQTAKAKVLPEHISKAWHNSLFIDDTFNGEVAVLQAGLEHKQTLVLVHGLGQLGMQDWFSVIPVLAKQYHIVTFDLPGFGYSAIPQGRYSPTNYAKVVAGITREYAKSKAIVIGHSMGGAISLRFASMFPELLSKLVLVDAAGILEKTAFIKHSGKLPIDEAQLPDVAKRFLAQANNYGGSMIESTSTSKFSQGLTNFLFNQNDYTRQLIVSSSPNLNAALSLVEENFTDAVYGLNVKTHIIWGAKDSVAPLRTGKVLANIIPNAQLQVIESAGHVPMKSHQEEFLTLLTQAIANAPVAIKKEQPETHQQAKLVCTKESNKHYQGHYQSITIKDCSNVTLTNITAQNLFIENSLVSIENMTVDSKALALEIVNSDVTISTGKIYAEHGISLSGSRLDMAGVSINVSNKSIYSRDLSSVVTSLSEINSPLYSGYTHSTYQLNQQSIDKFLPLE